MRGAETGRQGTQEKKGEIEQDEDAEKESERECMGRGQ